MNHPITNITASSQVVTIVMAAEEVEDSVASSVFLGNNTFHNNYEPTQHIAAVCFTAHSGGFHGGKINSLASLPVRQQTQAVLFLASASPLVFFTLLRPSMDHALLFPPVFKQMVIPLLSPMVLIRWLP